MADFRTSVVEHAETFQNGMRRLTKIDAEITDLTGKLAALQAEKSTIESQLAAAEKSLRQMVASTK